MFSTYPFFVVITFTKEIIIFTGDNDQKTQFYSKMQYQIAMNHINDTIFELLVSKLWVKTSQFSNMNFKQNLNVFIIIAHTSPPIRFV